MEFGLQFVVEIETSGVWSRQRCTACCTTNHNKWSLRFIAHDARKAKRRIAAAVSCPSVPSVRLSAC